MNTMVRFYFATLFGCIGVASIATAATITSFTWSPAPPTITTLNQTFPLGASAYADETNSVELTIYRNGVSIGWGDMIPDDTGHESYFYSPNISISTNNATFTAIATSGSISLSLSVLVNETTPPSTPTNFAAILTPSSCTVSWTASTDNVGVTGYELRRDSTSLGTETGTSRSVSGLVYNVPSVLTVRARDAFGNWSNWSAPLTVTLDATSPTAPGSLASPSQTGTSVTLTWTAATDNVGVVAYDIYRTWAGGTLLLATTGPGTLSFVDAHVAPATMYTYHLKARDQSTNVSPASNTVAVTIVPLADGDSDGLPDVFEALFGTTANANPSGEANHNLKVHRPVP